MLDIESDVKILPDQCVISVDSSVFWYLGEYRNIDSHLWIGMTNLHLDICNEIALRWIPQDFTDSKSTLAQVMAWCRHAPSHYLNNVDQVVSLMATVCDWQLLSRS